MSKISPTDKIITDTLIINLTALINLFLGDWKLSDFKKKVKTEIDEILNIICKLL